MNNYIVAKDRGEEINWNIAYKINCFHFETAAEFFADNYHIVSDIIEYGLDVQVKCVETGIIKKFEIEANIEFDVKEIVE